MLMRAKLLAMPHQTEAVLDIALVHALQRIEQILLIDLDLLDPKVQILIRGQLQHLQGLLLVADVRGAELDAVGLQGLGLELDALALGEADADEVAVDVHDREVLGEGEVVVGGGGVDDDVEGEVVGLLPAGLRGGDEAVDAHLLGVGFLGARTRDRPHLGTQRFGEDEPEVPDPADPDDADFLARSAPVAHERRVGGEPGAEHRSRELGFQTLRDREDVSFVAARVAGVATGGGDVGAGVLATVGVGLEVGAVVLVVVCALLAFEAGEALGTLAHALAGFNGGDFVADAESFADDLVTNADREVLRSPTSSDGVDIRVADPAGFDFNVDVVFTERFEGEGSLVQGLPGISGFDLETGRFLRVRHLGDF